METNNPTMTGLRNLASKIFNYDLVDIEVETLWEGGQYVHRAYIKGTDPSEIAGRPVETAIEKNKQVLEKRLQNGAMPVSGFKIGYKYRGFSLFDLFHFEDTIVSWGPVE